VQRDAAAVKFFPPALPLLAVLLGEALDRLWPITTGTLELPVPARYWLGGALIVAAVLGLGLWSVLIMRRSGQSENPWQPTVSIVEQGPFRFSRNPMYLQMVLVCLGFAIVSWNVWTLLLTPVCGWLLQRLAILPEEAYLDDKFGDAYRDYRRRVRRWI
jgi:protein-S-isoprenylcysteine O-methyltransferase Ste14